MANGHDCRPHIAFDIACLVKSGQLGTLKESVVPAWQKRIVKCLHQLPIYDPKEPQLTVHLDEVIDLTID